MIDNIISRAFNGGLVSGLATTRQTADGLVFVAHGSAPGQPRIEHESASEPERAVIAVLTTLARLSPKKSPRGGEAAEILDMFDYSVPERDKDPEPKKTVAEVKKGVTA